MLRRDIAKSETHMVAANHCKSSMSFQSSVEHRTMSPLTPPSWLRERGGVGAEIFVRSSQLILSRFGGYDRLVLWVMSKSVKGIF